MASGAALDLATRNCSVFGVGGESDGSVQKQGRYSVPHLSSSSFATGTACLLTSVDETPSRKKAGYPGSPLVSCRSYSPESHVAFSGGHLPGRTSPSLESDWCSKKRTANSCRMQSGDDVRLTLSQGPSPSMRRMNSMPPRFGRPDEDVSCVVSIAVASTSEKGQCGSTLVRNFANNSSTFDLCSKLHRTSDLHASAAPGDTYMPAPSQAFHTKGEILGSASEDDHNIPRFRSDGAAISNRGKASSGIPWRQIPSYSRNGLLGGTGDKYPDNSRQRVEMDCKRKAHFSHKLAGSNGVKSTLGVLKENCENCSPECVSRRVVSPREAWLSVVRRRQQAKLFRPDQVKSVNSGAQDANDEPRCIADLHIQWRQQRKTVHPPEALKDACPYFRDDSAPDTRPIQPPTPHRRCNLSPSPRGGYASSPYASVSAGEVGPPESVPPHSSERVSEARRDWQYYQDKAECGEPEDGLLRESSSGSAFMNRFGSARSMLRSSSNRSFSPQTACAVQHPVHSIRARPPGPQRPRWK